MTNTTKLTEEPHDGMRARGRRRARLYYEKFIKRIAYDAKLRMKFGDDTIVYRLTPAGRAIVQTRRIEAMSQDNLAFFNELRAKS